MNASEIVECDSEEEAEEAAVEMSLQVMDSYQQVMDIFYEEASHNYEGDFIDIEEMKMDNTAYEIFEIVDTKGKSIAELENEFHSDKDTFVKIYCN